MTEKVNSQSRIFQENDITHQQIKESNFKKVDNSNNPELTQQIIVHKNSRRKFYIILGLAVCFAFVAVILGVTLGLLLKKKQEPEPAPSPQPAPYIYSCLDFPTDCQGVLQSVQSYIMQSSSHPDQIRAQLQIGRYFSNMQTNTRINLTGVYKGLVSSVECLAYNMPDTFSQAYLAMAQLQFQTQQSLIDYINLTYSFSGQSLLLTTSTQVTSTCQFNITSLAASRVRNLQSTCSPNPTAVLLYCDGNGYSPISTFRNLQTIQQLFQQNSSVSFDGGAIYIGSYRVDGSTDFFLNLITSFEQNLQNNNHLVPSRISLLKCLRVIIDGGRANEGLPSDVTQQVMDQLYKYLNMQTMLSMSDMQTNYNLDWHKQFVSKQINEGKKVVLVAHSQGTYYANSLYNLLSGSQKSSVGLVYTAPLASSMADGLINYISNPADAVITAFTATASATNAFPVPLSSNVPSFNFNSSYDAGYNHDFRGYTKSYMPQLSQLIISAKSRIAQPASLGSGPITALLRWDSQPDLDLHVFQPNNVHVYYMNLQGAVGGLYLDASNGYGPELYYTHCQTMVAGEYTIAVNYYDGSGPSTMTMSVSAGNEYLAKTIVLPTSMGSAGDYNPTYVCKIVVTLVNPSTRFFTYKIIQ